METKSLFVVYTKRLAGKLCDLGFNCVRSERNDTKPWLYVYLFEDTPELRAAVEQYK